MASSSEDPLTDLESEVLEEYVKLKENLDKVSLSSCHWIIHCRSHIPLRVLPLILCTNGTHIARAIIGKSGYGSYS